MQGRRCRISWLATFPVLSNNVTDQGLDLHRAGKIRIVSVCAEKRLAELPEVAPASETLPGLIARTFTAVLVPAATPREIVDQLAAANAKIMSRANFQARLAKASFEPVVDTPEEARRFIEKEIAALGPRIKALPVEKGVTAGRPGHTAGRKSASVQVEPAMAARGAGPRVSAWRRGKGKRMRIDPKGLVADECYKLMTGVMIAAADRG